jgi:dTDP-3-amino-3,4,6-trideoxy-alpha-D-glucose transaminase
MTTPLTAFATTLAIVRAGGAPVWVDVDDTGSLDLDLADATLRADPSIHFVMPVHLYGHPLDPGALARLSAEHDVTTIEDCAQSAGATRGDQPTGLVGAMAAVSLYPTKNLGAMGDGGVVLTADSDLARRARRLRDYGQSTQYEHAELGLNSRLDELHAAILRSALLPRLGAWLVRRRDIADRYRAGLLAAAPILRPMGAAGGLSASHLFPVEVLTPDPESVRQGLRERGVGVGRHYPVLCPNQSAVARLGRCVGELPVARRLAHAEMSLPLNPHLSDEEVDRVIDACVGLARELAC